MTLDIAPELKELASKYGCKLDNKPQYVLVGNYYSPSLGDTVYGVIAAANNELHAHILKREIHKRGKVEIHRTEYHPSGAKFKLSTYLKKIKEIIAHG